MQPLKARTSSSSPIETLAIELLRSTDRYQPPLGQKQRVRIRLLERSTPTRVLVPWPAIVIVLLVITAGASAALAGRWLTHRQATPVSLGSRHSDAVGIASGVRQSGDISSGLPSSKPDSTQVIDLASAEVPQTSDTRARTERHDGSPRVTQSSEKLLVFDAMRALRREGHPEKAAKLLDEYLRRYPDGSLAEEALALAIEASTALSDPRAKAFADKYLSRYPQGRFRSAAERVRSRFGP